MIEANPIDEQSTIIREIWEEHETNSVAWSSINDILNNNYSTNFSESWVGFCSRNLFNGLYLDMNNDFYYHEDQLDAEPIIFNEISNLDESINDFILGNKKVRFLAYEPSFNMFINISDIESVPSGANIIGNFVLESDNLDNQEIIDIYDFEFLQITDIDKIYLILGTSEDLEIGEFILMNANGCVNLVNKTTIQDLCTLAKDAQLAIGNDTGPMHAFSMSGCNSLVLFSDDSNPKRCAPRPINKKKIVKIIQKKDLRNLTVDEVLHSLRNDFRYDL